MSESVDRIHLRHLPFRDWILGASLLILDLIVLVLLVWNFVRNGSENLADSLLFFALLVLVGLTTWFYESINSLIFPAVSEIVIDARQRFVELTTHRIYGKHTDRYYFHQVEQIRSKKAKKRPKAPYYAELTLANRRTIAIRIPIADEKVEVTKFVKKVNKMFRSDAVAAMPVREWNAGQH
jgi:hypothetical protein